MRFFCFFETFLLNFNCVINFICKFLNGINFIICSCQGYVVPEKKDACNVNTSGPAASKVSIQAKKGDVWVLTPLKKKKDTYTIRAVSFESNACK